MVKENEYVNANINFVLNVVYNGMDENHVKMHKIKNLFSGFTENKFKNDQNVKSLYLKIKDVTIWLAFFVNINGDGFEEDNILKIIIMILFEDALDCNLHNHGDFEDYFGLEFYNLFYGRWFDFIILLNILQFDFNKYVI